MPVCKVPDHELHISVLEETSNQLAKLSARRLGCPSVTQEMAGCIGKIDHCPSEYFVE